MSMGAVDGYGSRRVTFGCQYDGCAFMSDDAREADAHDRAHELDPDGAYIYPRIASDNAGARYTSDGR